MNDVGNVSQIVDKPHLHRRTYRRSHVAVKRGTKRIQKCYKKKVELFWSKEDSLKLIKEIEIRPAIWDKGCEEHKLQKQRLAWQEVARAINRSSISDCQGKWQNLRTTFKRKIVDREKNIGESVVMRWPYFKSMQFLEFSEVRQNSKLARSVKLVSI